MKNKDNYLNKEEMKRYKWYFIEFCKVHSFVSAINIAKTYREEYMPFLRTNPILLGEVEKGLTHRASRLLGNGFNNGYLTKFSRKTYKIDHKKLKKYNEILKK